MIAIVDSRRPIQTRMNPLKPEFIGFTSLRIDTELPRQFSPFYFYHSNRLDRSQQNEWNLNYFYDVKFVSTAFKPFEQSDLTLAAIQTSFNSEVEDVVVKPKYISEFTVKARISQVDKSIPKIFVD